jgi:hypothetical protein
LQLHLFLDPLGAHVLSSCRVAGSSVSLSIHDTLDNSTSHLPLLLLYRKHELTVPFFPVLIEDTWINNQA